MEARIGLNPESPGAVAHILSKILSDEFVLAAKTRNAHWNIQSSDFYEMHKFFEDQYSQLDEIIDQTAERIRSLGHYAPATLKQYLELTQFTEETGRRNDKEGFINELLIDHENLIIELRKNIKIFEHDLKDIGSSDFIIALMRVHERIAWMLRAHLK